MLGSIVPPVALVYGGFFLYLMQTIPEPPDVPPVCPPYPLLEGEVLCNGEGVKPPAPPAA